MNAHSDGTMNSQMTRQFAHGGRLTKWKGRAASIAPGMLSVSVIALSTGLGHAQTVITTPLVTPQTVVVDEDVTVTATGSVTLVGENAEQAIEIDVADYTSDALLIGNLSYLGGSASGTAHGLSLTGNLSGTIVNQGTITLDVADTASVTLIGIDVDGDVSGSITNTGTITVTGNALGSSASVAGIEVGGVLSGTITNGGLIEVAAISDTDEADAWGIYVSDVTATAAIVNSGTITANAFTFTSSSATAYGIEVDSALVAGATITNSGLIDVEAESITYEAYAYGIYVDGDVGGDISNSGQILASAIGGGTTADTMVAIGIYGDGSLTGSITNSGLISADIFSLGDSYSASGIGIYVDDVAAGGVISNSGMINVALDGQTFTHGVQLGGIASAGAMDGDITNSGSISIVADVVAVTGTEFIAAGISADGALSGSVTNSGTIDIVVNIGSADIGITAAGISTNNNTISGAITNSGAINVAVTLPGTGSLSDLLIFGIEGGNLDATGTVENSGSIIVSGSVNALGNAYAEVYGIDLGPIDGSLSNSGMIQVSASATGSATDWLWAYAYGIVAGTVSATGSITNDGSIEVMATASGTATGDSIYASAFGMALSTIDGTVSNGGSISAMASATGSATDWLSAYAYGIVAGTVSATGSITNDGSIEVMATASGTATGDSIYASAFGMALSTIDGTVSNGGSISAMATVTGSGTDGLSVYAFGIEASTVNGILTNDGSIEAMATASGTATSESIYASAFGMEMSTINGTVFNGGSIGAMATVTGSGTDGLSVYAFGIEASTVNGILTNDGSIEAMATASGTATGESIYASAYGMELFDINGTLSNAGTITVAATATGSGLTPGGAFAYGMEMGTVTAAGSVSQTGSIIVMAEAENDNTLAPSTSEAVGIDIDTLDGTLFNSGTVIAMVENGGDAFAVQVGGGGGTATFTTESFFVGRLSLQNAELNVTSFANTGSIYWTFEDIPGLVTLDDSNGPTLYFNGVDVVATVEPAAQALSGQIAGDIASMGADTMASLLAGAPATGASVFQNTMSSQSPVTGGGMTGFVQGEFNSRQIEDGAGNDLDYDIAGLTAGLAGTLQNGLGYGITLSGVDATGNVDGVFGTTDTIDTSGVMLGIYGNTSFSGVSLTFGANFGLLTNDSSRNINDNLAPGGISTVSADYDSTFISPSVELSYVFDTGSATIRPYAGYRYTRLSIDGYAESGGLGAASFSGRDVDISDFIVGVDTSLPLGMGTFSGSAAVLRRNVSDDGTIASLFGMSGNVATAATDFTALELGIGYGIDVGPSGSMNFGVSGMFGDSGVSGYGLTASYRLEF